MPNSYGSFAYATEEYAGPAVSNSPFVATNQGRFPLRFVEIAPGYGPNDPNPVWIDIASDVTELSTKRGRQHTLGRFEAGDMRLTIDNKSGRYSPFNPASPYYGLIRPGMPIRFRALWGAVTYPRFAGVVESWPLTWPSASDSIVNVTAVDGTKFLNLKKATSIGAYGAAVAATTPLAWYRLNDAAGSTTAADSSGNGRTLAKRDYHDANPALPYTQAYYFQNEGALVADTDASFYAGHLEVVLKNSTFSVSTGFSLECWVNLSGQQATEAVVFQQLTATLPYMALGADSSGHAAFGGGGSTAATTTAITDGKWHHLVGTVQSAANDIYTVYVDGVQYGSVVSSGSWSGNPFKELLIGGHETLGDVAFYLDGAIDEVAVYSYVLTPAQVATHYNAGAHPRQLETTGARIAYLASYTGIPAANQRIDAGQSTVQGATDDWLNKTIGQNMQDQSDTEDGDLFFDAAGNFTFFDRLHTSRSPYSSVSLLLGDRASRAAESIDLPGTSGAFVSTPDSAAASVGANKLTANQAQIETDATAWSPNLNAPTLARSIAQFRDGAASLSMTATAAGPTAMSATLASNAPVVAGQTYTARAFFRPGSTARTVNVDIQWYGGAGFISTTTAAGATEGAGTFTAASQTVQAPDGATSCKVELRVSAVVATEVHYVDAVSLVDGTGDLTLVWYGSADDWSPAAARDLVSKENPSTQRSYMWDIQPTGLPFLRISPDGSSVSYSSTATANVPFADGTTGGLAVAWRASDGRTQFFTTTSSLDAIRTGTATWTPLGADRTVNAGTIFDANSLLTIGARGDAGASDPFAGNVQYAEVRSGLATLSSGRLTGGTAVAVFDPIGYVTVTSPTTPTVLSSRTGELWTVNGTGWSWVTGAPEEPYRLDGLSVPYDDDDVVNEVVVTPAGMAPQVASDATSQSQYGKRTKAIGILSSTAQDAATRAAAELARYKTALPRIDSVTVNPSDDPTMLFGPVLGSDLLTRIQLRRRPLDGSGSIFDQVALIEGIEDRVTKATWQTTWRISSTDAL